MGATWVAIREKTIWVVEADRSDKRESASWRFDDEEVAEWFRKIASQYYMARCPTCETKDILGVELSVDLIPEVIVSCGFDDCEFAKRIVRTGQWVENIPGLDG